MAGYELVGNLNTRHLVNYCDENNIVHSLDPDAFENAYNKAMFIY